MDHAAHVSSPLSRRDLAVLRAVAAGHCELVADCGPVLLVDGLCCSDQLAAVRLTAAGLIEPPAGHGPAPARLTSAGAALLASPVRPAGRAA